MGNTAGVSFIRWLLWERPTHKPSLINASPSLASAAEWQLALVSPKNQSPSWTLNLFYHKHIKLVICFFMQKIFLPQFAVLYCLFFNTISITFWCVSQPAVHESWLLEERCAITFLNKLINLIMDNKTTKTWVKNANICIWTHFQTIFILHIMYPFV